MRRLKEVAESITEVLERINDRRRTILFALMTVLTTADDSSFERKHKVVEAYHNLEEPDEDERTDAFADATHSGELLVEDSKGLAEAGFIAPAPEWENFDPLQAEFNVVESESEAQEAVLFQDLETDRADVGV